MIAGRILGATHNFGKPEDWDDSKSHCGGLALRLEPADGKCEWVVIHHVRVELTPQSPQMVSAWFPNADELARLQAGAPVHLGVLGTMHPPVFLEVGAPPDDEDSPPR